MRISFLRSPVLLILIPLIPLILVPVLARGSRWRETSPRVWGSVALRLGIALAIVLSLAGMQLVREVDTLTVVYLIDLSDSISAAERERAERFIRESVQAMPPNGRAAIVAFGHDALVERLASEDRDVPPIASVPVTTRTNLAAALRLGLALFPEASQKRIVILSDGLENLNQASDQVDLAVARGVEIDYVPLDTTPSGAEAYLDRIEAPARVRLGQRFEVTAVIESTKPQSATLYLFEEGKLIRSLALRLQRGTNRVRISLTAGGSGFRRLRAELIPEVDRWPQNNVAESFTVVEGPPRLLLVEGKAGEATHLAAALKAAGMEPVVISPAEIPQDLAALVRYDAVFLVNVPAEALPDGVMEVLPRYVQELGRGLTMIGGDSSFGAGGYLRTPIEEALPVDMDVRSREREPNLALVFVVDKSGSMGRCHCNDPNALPGQYQRVESGLPKIDIAKEAILRTYPVLGRLDLLGVIAFDAGAHWAVRLRRLTELGELQEAIGGIQAEGQTNIFAGLNEAAQALSEIDARVKHIILLTDGWSRAGAYDELAKQLREEGITLSVIAAGRGSAAYLRGLAEAGGGRYYPARSIQELPQLFLKETIRAAGRYIIERPFYPVQTASAEILEGLTGWPRLYGYNGTTPKAAARVPLMSAEGDPILALWSYGLGRSLAWTSDLTTRWAVEWVSWDGFSRFVAQMAGWILPAPSSDRLQAEWRIEGDEVELTVDAVDEAGRPWDLLDMRAVVVGPDLHTHQLTLSQIAPGRYQARMALDKPGVYMLQVLASERGEAGEEGAPVAQITTGMAIPYSPEYRWPAHAEGEALLRRLAQATGGDRLVEPAAAWTRTSAPARSARPLAPTLLLLATVLFPADVAVRRLRLGAREWGRLKTWAREHIPQRRRKGVSEWPIPPARPQRLGRLFAARERGRARSARGRSTSAPADLPQSEDEE
ncbi:MAG TPA: VWA domain-containing protein [Caldilineae bacterium]|nr:VWA domain-containing protein [Caldilineae bacterium]